MSSKVQIANRAITKLGASRIISLTDSNTVASTINSMFEDVLKQELRRNNWRFAIKRTTLVQSADKPEWGYQNAYELPVDFLQLIQVNDKYIRPFGGQSFYSLEGRKVLTNLPAPLRLRYTYYVQDTSLFDPLFEEVLACKLAMESAEALTQNTQKRDLATREYQFAIQQAVRQTAIEVPPEQLPYGSWFDSRHLDEGFDNRDAQQTTDYFPTNTIIN